MQAAILGQNDPWVDTNLISNLGFEWGSCISLTDILK